MNELQISDMRVVLDFVKASTIGKSTSKLRKACDRLEASMFGNANLPAPWLIRVNIDTDDDFQLDIGTEFEISAATKSAAQKATIEKLKAAQFTYLKTWGVNNTGREEDWVRGDYSENWFAIRDEAIKQLKRGNHRIHYGGNQTITVEVISQYQLK